MILLCCRPISLLLQYSIHPRSSSRLLAHFPTSQFSSLSTLLAALALFNVKLSRRFSRMAVFRVACRLSFRSHCCYRLLTSGTRRYLLHARFFFVRVVCFFSHTKNTKGKKKTHEPSGGQSRNLSENCARSLWHA